MSDQKVHEDPEFMARRDEARQRIDALTGAVGGAAEDRLAWFHAVYREAGGDPAAIPWADLAPKVALLDWLGQNPGNGRRAIDIGCGLGDNAQALAQAGYETTAFDLSPDAIAWAKRRFPQSPVHYRVADLFAPPSEWSGAFDLVHESYTVQALDGDLRQRSVPAIAALVAPGGRLIFFNRSRPEGASAEGPPWPVMPSEWRMFEEFGLVLTNETEIAVERPGRTIAHVLAVFERPA
ncbi:class I SAM-dependent methyltransferase [Roseibium aquae]|uniref:class I SAM-dependent methyltransferase n=1 Tax=Roseibium aquae TaxID=1323746 RepID=UPI001AD949FB|nr:class I SAM-dependent methyltransferase [Roseibium aquae]